MNFRPELAKQVRMGKKTQTRQPVKATDTDQFGITKCRYVTGRSYSIQAGRKSGYGRLTVLDVRRDRLGDITLADARREGFKTTDEFKDHWADMYGSFDPDTEVWVISFRVGDLERDRQRRAALSESERIAGLAQQSDFRERTKLAGDLRAIEQYVDKVERELEISADTLSV
jgi:hypothetical protein